MLSARELPKSFYMAKLYFTTHIFICLITQKNRSEDEITVLLSLGVVLGEKKVIISSKLNLLIPSPGFSNHAQLLLQTAQNI